MGLGLGLGFGFGFGFGFGLAKSELEYLESACEMTVLPPPISPLYLPYISPISPLYLPPAR